MEMKIDIQSPLEEHYRYVTLAEQQAKKKANEEKWDNRFLELARHYSTWSKDESTKVGCVITSRDKNVISSGYNGLPRRLRDDVPARLLRPEKLLWFEHAERNAIYSAAKRGTALGSSTAYSTLCPCMDCARGLIQSGISRVVCPEPDLVKYSLWADQFQKVSVMFREAGVRLDYV